MNGQIAIRIARAAAGSAAPSLGHVGSEIATVTEKLIKTHKSFSSLDPERPRIGWLKSATSCGLAP